MRHQQRRRGFVGTSAFGRRYDRPRSSGGPRFLRVFRQRSHLDQSRVPFRSDFCLDVHAPGRGRAKAGPLRLRISDDRRYRRSGRRDLRCDPDPIRSARAYHFGYRAGDRISSPDFHLRDVVRAAVDAGARQLRPSHAVVARDPDDDLVVQPSRRIRGGTWRARPLHRRGGRAGPDRAPRSVSYIASWRDNRGVGACDPVQSVRFRNLGLGSAHNVAASDDVRHCRVAQPAVGDGRNLADAECLVPVRPRNRADVRRVGGERGGRPVRR